MILTQEVKLLEVIDEAAKMVSLRVRKITKTVTSNVFGEWVSSDDILSSAKTAVFETLHESPDLRGDELIEASISIYKRYLWAVGTSFYDKTRRDSPSPSRAKVFADSPQLPWGAPPSWGQANLETRRGARASNWHERMKPVQICYIDEEKIFGKDVELPKVSMIEIFGKLKNFCGVEIATIYIFHHGFGYPLSFLVKELLGLEEGSREFSRVYRRIHRIMGKMESVIPREFAHKLK